MMWHVGKTRDEQQPPDDFCSEYIQQTWSVILIVPFHGLMHPR